jgi:hypothetical protein
MCWNGQGTRLVIVQIHGRKKLLKGLKWPLQNGPSIPGRAAGFALHEKGCLQVWGWRCSKVSKRHAFCSLPRSEWLCPCRFSKRGKGVGGVSRCNCPCVMLFLLFTLRYPEGIKSSWLLVWHVFLNTSIKQCLLTYFRNTSPRGCYPTHM